VSAGERVAVVTGGSRSIGLAIARELGRGGARIALVARDQERLEQATAQLRREGTEADAWRCDLGDREATNGLAREVSMRSGIVQALVNNAGVAELVPAAETTDEYWNRAIEVNLSAAFALVRGLVDALVASGNGAVVSISSVMGIATTAGLAPYSASKAGLQHLTKALAVELGPRGVRVNAGAPGFIRTDMFEEHHPPARQEALARAHPLRRTGRVEEIASVVAFLCSDRASFVSGVTLPVDGGLTRELAIPSLLESSFTGTYPGTP
jgi:NAD(P)-dependent dehydrogenase (short-subunit alcohol dehydrogenase family)